MNKMGSVYSAIDHSIHSENNGDILVIIHTLPRAITGKGRARGCD